MNIVQFKFLPSINTGIGSPVVAFDAPTTAGNLIAVFTEIGYTFGTVGSVTDSASEVYQKAGAFTDGNSIELEGWFFPSNAGGVTNVTVNFAGGFYPSTAVLILEIAGADPSAPLDAFKSGSSVNAGTMNAGTVTPAHTNEIIIVWAGATANSGTTTSVFTADGAFAMLVQGFANNGTNNISAVGCETQVVSSMAAVDGDISWSPVTTYGAGIAVSFFGSGAPPPPSGGKGKPENEFGTDTFGAQVESRRTTDMGTGRRTGMYN